MHRIAKVSRGSKNRKISLPAPDYITNYLDYQTLQSQDINLASIQQKLRQTKTIADDAITEMNTTKQENRELSDEIIRLKKEYAQMLSSIQGATESMTDLRRTNEELTKRFSEQSQQNETYKARVSNLEAELEIMRDKVAEFDAMEERLHELEEFEERTLQAGNDVIAHNTPKPQETKSEGIPHSDDIDLHKDSLKRVSSMRDAMRIKETTNTSYEQTNPSISSVIAETIREYLDTNGNFGFSSILDFQDGVEQIYLAGRSADRNDVLEAMKLIVAVVHDITEAAKEFEEQISIGSRKTLKIPLYLELSPNNDHIKDLRNKVTQYTKNLMEAAKKFTSRGTEALKELDDASFCLADTVLDIVKIMGIDESTYEPPYYEQEQIQLLPDKRMTMGSLTDMKRFLEEHTDLIVTNITTLMHMLRKENTSSEKIQLNKIVATICDVVEDLEDRVLTGLALPMSITGKSAENREQLQARQEEGTRILSGLEEARIKLEAAAASIDGEDGKSKIAPAAYDVAKHTKELVSLFEF